MALYPITKKLQQANDENTSIQEETPLFYDTIKGRIPQTAMPPSTSEGWEIPIPKQPKSYKRRFERDMGDFYDPLVVDEEYMAQRQSGLERMTYFVPRIATKVVSEVLQMPGYLGGAVSWAASGGKPEEIWRMVDNKWLQAIQSIEQDAKDRLPVYVKQAIKEGTLVQNIFSSQFWATEGADGIGFMLSFLLPGMAIRAIGLGDKIAKLVGKTVQGAKLVKTLETGAELTAAGSRFAGYSDDVLSTIINTIFESAAETGESYRDILTRLLDETDDLGNPKYTNEEARQLAGQVAANVMQKNFGILLVSNALEQRWLFNGWSTAKRGADAATKRAKRSVLQRIFNSDYSAVLDEVATVPVSTRVGQYTKNLFQNMVKEGFWEEGMQYVAPKKAEKEILEEGDVGLGNYITDVLDIYGDILSDVDMQKSVFLGTVLGVGMGIVQTRQQQIQERNLLKGTEARKASKLQKFFNIQDREATVGLHKLMKENELTRTKTLEDISTFNKKTGKYEVDPVKVKEFGSSVVKKAGWKALATLAANEGNEEGYRIIKDKLDADLMLPYLKVDGGLEVLKARINNRLAEEDIAEYKKLGIEGTVEEIKQDLIERAERLQDIYNRVDDTNAFAVDVDYAKENKAEYEDFVDLVKHNKLTYEFTADSHMNRINRILDQLSNYKSKGSTISITPTTTARNEKMVEELKESVKNNKENLTESDLKYINKKIDAVDMHIKNLDKVKEEIKKLYSKKDLQTDYEDHLKMSEDSKTENEDNKSKSKVDREASILPDDLAKKYKDNVAIEEFTVNNAKYEARHSAKMAVTYTDEEGRPLKQIGRFGEAKTNSIDFIIEEEQYYDEEGKLQTKKSSGSVFATLTSDTFLHKGKHAINFTDDVTTIKSVSAVREEINSTALVNTLETVLQREKDAYNNINIQIKETSQQIDYLTEQAVRLQEKELASLEKIGTVLTAKGKQRVQLVLAKVLSENGKDVEKAYLTLDEIQQHVQNLQDQILALDNASASQRQTLQMFENERDKIEALGPRALDFITKSVEHVTKLQANTEETKAATEVKISDTNDYIKKLQSTLSGYFTSAGKVLGIIDQINAVRNHPSIPAEEKLDNINQLITITLRGKIKLDQQEYINMGAGKLLSPIQWASIPEDTLADLKTIQQLGSLPANIENINNLIADQRNIISDLENDLDIQERQSNILSELSEVKKDLIVNFDQEYKDFLISMGIAQKLGKNKVFASPEEHYTDLFDYTKKFGPRHPYRGIDSWFTSQGNQLFAKVNDDVARWYTFVNNHARAKTKKGTLKYTMRSMTFDQVGDLPEDHILRKQLKFFTGQYKEDKIDGEDVKIPIVKTYDEIIRGQVPDEVQEDIKMVAFEGSKPLLVSEGGNLNPSSNKHIVFTAFALPRELTENDYTRFHFDHLKDAYIKKHFKLKRGQKLSDEQRDQLDTYIDDMLKEDIERYKQFRNDMKETGKIFYISSINPGKKVNSDEQLEVLDALDIKHPNQLKGNIRLESNKNDPNDYESTTDRYISGMMQSLRNGFLYIAHDNRYEIIKPKTLGETGDVDNILELFKLVAQKHKSAGDILNYLKTALHVSNLSNGYMLDITNEFKNNKPVPNTLRSIQFGVNSTISAEDLLDDTKNVEFKEFLKTKYWNFSKKHLGDETFVEYSVEKGKLQTKTWDSNKGGYLGFLFSPTKNTTKGLVNIKPLETKSLIYKAKNPQYINQSINLARNEEDELFRSKKKTKAKKVTTKKTSGEQSVFDFIDERRAEEEDKDDAWNNLGVTMPTKEQTKDEDEGWDESSFGVTMRADKPTKERKEEQSWEELSDKIKDQLINTFGDEATAKAAYEKSQGSATNLDREATRTDNYELEDLDRSLEWFKEKFPDFPIEVVEGLVNNKLWGQLHEGSKVLISNIAAVGTVYHEAFHVFSELFLTEDKQTALYKEAKDELGQDATETEIKEYLAEEFRVYMMSPESYSFTKEATQTKSWFRQLYDAILKFLGLSKEDTFEQRMEAFKMLNLETFPKERQLREITESFDRIAGFSDKELLTSIKDVNFNFFDILFGNFENDALLNMSDDLTFEAVYNSVRARYMMNQMKGLGHELTDKIVSHWTEIENHHRRLLKQYNIVVDPRTDEDDRVGDTASFKESNETNLKDRIPRPVRLLIASLPSVTRAVVKGDQISSAYETQSNANFNKIITLLSDQLSGITSFSEMVDTLEVLSEQYPELAFLRHRLGVNKKMLSKADVQIQNAFFTSFANNKNIPMYLIYSPTGDMYWNLADVEHQRSNIKNRWINNAKELAKRKDSVIVKEGEKYYIDVQAFRQLKGNPFKIISSLGITMYLPGNMKVEALDTTAATEYLDRLKEQFRNMPKGFRPQVDDLYDGDLIQNQKELEPLVDIALSYNLNDEDLMYINQDGNPEYSIALNSHVTNTKNLLNKIQGDNIPDEVKHLKPYDGTEGSLFNMNMHQWWDIFMEGGQMEVVLLKGHQNYFNKGSDIMGTMPGSYKSMVFNALLDNTIPLLRAADRKLEYAFRLRNANGELIKGPREVTDQHFKDTMVEYLKDELITSFAYFADRNNYGDKINNYKDNIKELRVFNFLYQDKYISKRLKNKPPPLEEFYNLNVTNATRNNPDSAILQDLANKYVSQYKTYLNSVMGSYIDVMVQNTFNSLVEDNIIHVSKQGRYRIPGIGKEQRERLQIETDPNGGFVSEKNVNKMIKVAIFNQFVGSNEQLKLFLGDIAYYKDMNDFHKRVTGAVSTKQNSNTENIDDHLNELYRRADSKTRDGTFHQVIVEDIIVSNDALKTKYPKYGKINTTDAQSWITLDGYRDFMTMNGGRWTDAEEMIYQYEIQMLGKRLQDHPEWGVTIPKEAYAEHTDTLKDTPIFNGKKLTMGDIDSALTILKPQGFGFIPMENGLNPTQMFKTSMAPIFPSALADDSKMFKEVLRMMKEGNDILTFNSAHKIATVTDPQGNMQKLFNDQYVVQPIKYGDIGIQLEIHKEEADGVTKSTQRMCLEFIDVLNLGTPKEGMQDLFAEYEQLTGQQVAQEKINLINRLGLKKQEGSNDYYLPNTEEAIGDFKEQLFDIFEKRLLPYNTLDAITQALDSEHKHLDIMINSEKIEQVLTAMIRDSVISLKAYGDMFIQESNAMYDRDLKFYREEDGKIMPMQVIIPLPRKWIPFVESIGGLAEFNKLIKAKDTETLGSNFSKLLQVVANRIPGQGMNSLEAMEIVEFVPPYHGSKIILPDGITIKAGSDFDVDKLTTYLNSHILLDRENGRPVYLEHRPSAYKDHKTARIQNRLNEISFEATLHPDRFDKLIKPNDTSKLKALSEEVKSKRALSPVEQAEEEATISELTQWWYNMQKAIQFWGSKKGIAQGAIQNVAHAIDQHSPLYMYSFVQLYFEDNLETDLYKSGFIKDSEGNDISDTLSDILSAFVDAVKNPFIFEIVDDFTMKGVAMLLRFGKNSGIGIRQVAHFMSQDIIKDYLKVRRANMVEYMFNNEYNSTEYSNYFKDKNFTQLFRLDQEGWYNKVVGDLAKRLDVDLSKVGKDVPIQFKDTLFVQTRKLMNNDFDEKRGENAESVLADYTKKEEAYKYKYFTPEYLSSKAIRKDFKAQVQILDNFLTYMEMGKQLNGVNKILRPYAKSTFGQTFLDLHNKNVTKMDQVEPLFSADNVKEILRNTLLNEFDLAQTEAENMYKWASLLLSDPVLSERMTFFSKYFENPKYSQKPTDKQKRMKTLKAHLATYLIIDSLGLNTEDLQKFYKSLYLGNSSVANELIKYKKRTELDNLAIDELQPILGSKQRRLKSFNILHNIATNHNRHDVFESDALESEIYNLYQNGTPDDSHFVMRLLYHSLLQGGLTGGTQTYLKFIPNRIFGQIADRAIEHFNTLDEASKKHKIDKFFTQFMMNNAHDPVIVPRSLFLDKHNTFNKRLNGAPTVNNYYGGSNIKFFSSNYQADWPASYYNKNIRPPIGIGLYRKNGETNSYSLVHKLGDNIRLFEYYPSATLEEVFDLTMLPQNKYSSPDVANYVGKNVTDKNEGEDITVSDNELNEINAQISEAVRINKNYKGGPNAIGATAGRGENKYQKYLDTNPTVNNILRVIANNSDNIRYRNLASTLKSITSLPLTLNKRTDEEFNAWGRFTFERGYKNPTIHYSASLDTDSFENAILHEALHAATVYAYINNSGFKNEVDKLYNYLASMDVKNNANLKEVLTHVDSPIELITYGLVDDSVQQVLQTIPGIEEGVASNKTFLSQLIDTIVNFISELFYGKTNNVPDTNALQDLMVLTKPYLTELQGPVETPIASDELMMELYQEGYLKQLQSSEDLDAFISSNLISDEEIQKEYDNLPVEYRQQIRDLWVTRKIQSRRYQIEEENKDKRALRDLGDTEFKPIGITIREVKELVSNNKISDALGQALIDMQKKMNKGDITTITDYLTMGQPIEDLKYYTDSDFNLYVDNKGKMETWDDIPADKIINNTKIRYLRDGTLASTLTDRYNKINNVKAELSRRPDDKFPYVIKVTKIVADNQSQRNAIKRVNEVELQKEGIDVNWGTQEILENFEKYYPNFDYMNNVERQNFVNALTTGEIEQICGL